MPKDPTAYNATKRSISSNMTSTISINGSESLKITEATARIIFGLLDVQYSPSTGEYFATLKEEAAALLQQDDGEVTSKGNQS